MPSHLKLDSLWDFSLTLYDQPGVADACLLLQDEQGVNVNLVLWCAWLEQLGLEPDIILFQEAQRHIRDWDEHYVVPLRLLRRRLKAEFGTEDASINVLRQRIQQAELAAEQQVQMALQTLTRQWIGQAQAGETAPNEERHELIEGQNLRRYLENAGVNRGAIDSLLQCLTGALRNI